MNNSILIVKLSDNTFFTFFINHIESYETIKDVFYMATLTQSENKTMNLMTTYLESKNIDFGIKIIDSLEDLKNSELYQKAEKCYGFDRLRLCYTIK